MPTLRCSDWEDEADEGDEKDEEDKGDEAVRECGSLEKYPFLLMLLIQCLDFTTQIKLPYFIYL
ncbi:MAG: hypothetical protein ACREPR_13330 [Brasilonema sp.]